jgi:hypothetical protein
MVRSWPTAGGSIGTVAIDPLLTVATGRYVELYITLPKLRAGMAPMDGQADSFLERPVSTVEIVFNFFACAWNIDREDIATRKLTFSF